MQNYACQYIDFQRLLTYRTLSIEYSPTSFKLSECTLSNHSSPTQSKIEITICQWDSHKWKVFTCKVFTHAAMCDVERWSHLILKEGFECLLLFYKFLVVFPHCDTACMPEMNMHRLHSQVTQLKPIKIESLHPRYPS